MKRLPVSIGILMSIIPGGFGILFLWASRVDPVWLGILTLLALGLWSLKFVPMGRVKVFLAAVALVAIVVVTVHGWNDAAPARARDQAQKAAQLAAEAETKALYGPVIADLKRQGFLPGVFEELGYPEVQTPYIVRGEGVLRIKLKFTPTGRNVVLNVRKLENGWMVVCPLMNGGWLATYERNNWLAAELAQTGQCPPAIA